jgi:hypothetical protein
VLRVRSKKRTRTNWIHFSHRLEKNNPTRGKEMKDALLTEAEAALLAEAACAEAGPGRGC